MNLYAKRRMRITVSSILIIGWLAIVLSRTVVPVGAYDVSGKFRAPVAWWPGQSIWAVVHYSANPAWQLLGNAMMLLPVGFIAGIGLGWSTRNVALFAIAISMSIEVVQWWAVPVRVAALDDVILNLGGALLGVALARRTQRPKPRN